MEIKSLEKIIKYAETSNFEEMKFNARQMILDRKLYINGIKNR